MYNGFVDDDWYTLQNIYMCLSENNNHVQYGASKRRNAEVV